MLLPITSSGSGCRAGDIQLFMGIKGNRSGMNKHRLRVSVCCPRSAVAQLVWLRLFWLTVPISRFLWPCSISVCCGAPATVPQQLFTRRPPLSGLRYVHLFFYSLWHLPWASLLCVLSLLARFIIVKAHLQRLNFFWTAIDHVSLLIISLPAGIVATSPV